MSVSLLAAVAALTGVGVYLVTARSLSRIVLGFSMLGHAAVLALLAAGGPAGDAPLADRYPPEESANPLPQALGLTAIVISFGLTLFLLALARRQHLLTGDDLVEDDLEDRRIAAGADHEDHDTPGAAESSHGEGRS
jgi:multicomponent Na+:H+ antiporter subunit C